MLLSACSSQEEEQWRNHLLDLSSKAGRTQPNDEPLNLGHSILGPHLKSIGNVPGHPGTPTQGLSVQRAATVASRPNRVQVVIKNTYALKEGANPSVLQSARIARLRSSLSTNNRMPVLSPKRTDRVRIEQDMTKVWTKELLPFPGMTVNAKRVSATSVIRKFSKISIASSFSKRSVSHANIHKTNHEHCSRKLEFIEGEQNPVEFIDSIESCTSVIKSFGNTILYGHKCSEDSKLTTTSPNSIYQNQNNPIANGDGRKQTHPSENISMRPRKDYFAFIRRITIKGSRVYIAVVGTITPRATRKVDMEPP